MLQLCYTRKYRDRKKLNFIWFKIPAKKRKRLLHRASSQLVSNMFLSFYLSSHHSPTFKRVWTVKDGLKPLTLTLTHQTINLEPGLIRMRTGRNGERKITFDFMKSHKHKANVCDYFYVGEDLAKDQRLIQKKGKKDWRKMRLVFTLVWFSTSIGCLVASTRLQSF